MDCVNVAALANLLKPVDENSDSEDEKPTGMLSHMCPADVGPPSSKQAGFQSQNIDTGNNTTTSSKQSAKSSKDIWDAEEVGQGEEYDDVYDPRPQPEYDIVYKQAVTSEDMFLQMGNKTPSTASCEAMVIKIQLPDTKIADVELDVKDTFLNCRTPKYKLGLHLPHPVDSKSGKAQWDTTKHLLSVNLQMVREYDFMNF